MSGLNRDSEMAFSGPDSGWDMRGHAGQALTGASPHASPYPGAPCSPRGVVFPSSPREHCQLLFGVHRQLTAISTRTPAGRAGIYKEFVGKARKGRDGASTPENGNN